MSLVPTTSSIVIINLLPASKKTSGSANSPVLISGPLVSSNIATGLLSSSLTFFTTSILPLCSSWEPCEKLNLQTLRPFCINFFNTSSLWEAGPKVQTIFVFLALLSIFISS